jgi:hypothetical protein
MRKMGIEHGCDDANQEFRAVADRKPVVGERHGAVGDEALDPRPIDDRGSRPCRRPARRSAAAQEAAADRRKAQRNVRMKGSLSSTTAMLMEVQAGYRRIKDDRLCKSFLHGCGSFRQRVIVFA